jgi:hypothetical protein
MPGLAPGIHDFLERTRQGVDGQDKVLKTALARLLLGHDDRLLSSSSKEIAVAPRNARS